MALDYRIQIIALQWQQQQQQMCVVCNHCLTWYIYRQFVGNRNQHKHWRDRKKLDHIRSAIKRTIYILFWHHFMCGVETTNTELKHKKNICKLDNQNDNDRIWELKHDFHMHLLLAQVEIFISANKRCTWKTRFNSQAYIFYYMYWRM